MTTHNCCRNFLTTKWFQ